MTTGDWVLVIDDDPNVTDFLRRGLVYEGFQVNVANSGKAGLDIARERPPDLVVNGKAFPDTEPYVVSQGDLVRVRIINPNQTIHPMHLHGHDFLVVAQDGHPIPPAQQGALNTQTVNPGETYDIAFVADNPGRWVFHCHELLHAANAGVEPGGLIVLVEYEDFEAPDLGAPLPLDPAPCAAPAT